MSRFEFIFVLISIVAGLALTRLLSGLTQALRRFEQEFDVAHFLYSLVVIVLLFSIWWNSFRWEDNEVWTYSEYSLLCVYMSMFYAMAAILNPGYSRAIPRFEEIRTPFYVTFILYSLTEWLVVHIRDGQASPDYVVMISVQSLLMGIAVFLRRIRFDQLLAAWNLITGIAWQHFARSAG